MNRPKLSYTLRIIASLFLGLIVHQVFPQNKRIDSIRSVLDTVSTPRIHVDALNDLSAAYNFINADSSEYFVDKGLALAKEINYDKGSAKALRQKGIIQYIRRDFSEAIIWIDSSLVFWKKTEDLVGQLLAMNNMASMYQGLGEYDRSKEIMLRALRIAKANKIKKREAGILNSLGSLYSKINEFDSSMYFHKASLEIYRDLNQLPQMALVVNNIGTIHFRRSQFQQALDWFKESYEFASESQDPRTKSIASENIATLYSTVGLHERAIEWYQVLLILAEESSDKTGQLSISYNISAAYLENGQHQMAYDQAMEVIKLDEADKNQNNSIAKSYYIAASATNKLGNVAEAIGLLNNGLTLLNGKELQTESRINNLLSTLYFEEGEYNKAESLAQRNIDIEGEVVFPDVLVSTYKTMAKLASKRNNFRLAFDYLQIHESFQDKLLDEEKTNAVIRNSIAFDTERKELELQIALKKAAVTQAELEAYEANTKTSLSILVGLFLILSLIVIWRFQVVRNKRRILAQDKERLSLLRENERLKSLELTNKLELKHKEVLSQALQLAQKNESMLDIKKRLTKEVEERPNDSLRRTIRSLDTKINLENDWSAFRASFEGVYESFFDQLKLEFPSLTARELQLCALLKLNLSIKEMSNVLGISQEGVKKARYRIRKKLGLTDSPEQISAFLLNY